MGRMGRKTKIPSKQALNLCEKIAELVWLLSFVKNATRRTQSLSIALWTRALSSAGGAEDTPGINTCGVHHVVSAKIPDRQVDKPGRFVLAIGVISTLKTELTGTLSLITLQEYQIRRVRGVSVILLIAAFIAVIVAAAVMVIVVVVEMMMVILSNNM